MPRVKRGVAHLKKRRALHRRVKGFGDGRNNLLKAAKQADVHAGMHAFRDRRRKKGQFRRLWQVRINAAVRELDLTYSVFINKLKIKEVGLDRKVLSQIAGQSPDVFKKIVEFVK